MIDAIALGFQVSVRISMPRVASCATESYNAIVRMGLSYGGNQGHSISVPFRTPIRQLERPSPGSVHMCR